MKITKQQLQKLIKEEMDSLGLRSPLTGEPGQEHGVVSMEKIDRLREMKTEVDEMVDMVGPDIDEMAKMSLKELAREFETTIAALEIR